MLRRILEILRLRKPPEPPRGVIVKISSEIPIKTGGGA